MPLKGSFEERVVGVKRFIPKDVVSADETMYATVGWCRLYAQRNDESEVHYTFSKNESLKSSVYQFSRKLGPCYNFRRKQIRLRSNKVFK